MKEKNHSTMLKIFANQLTSNNLSRTTLRFSLIALLTFSQASFAADKPLNRKMHVSTQTVQKKASAIKKASLKEIFSKKIFISKDVFKGKKEDKNAGSINPKVLELALKAHSKAHSLGLAKKQLITIIDYSLPSTKPRLWVFDPVEHKVIFHTHVAHGSGSGDNHARYFSDIPGSLQSSLGVFVTGKTYHGKHGLSLNLHGLEKGINGNAEKRRIVVHAADYVNPFVIEKKGRLGRSWGCPALDNKIAKPIIHTIKEGSLIFAYYPDDKWLKKSQFL